MRLTEMLLAILRSFYSVPLYHRVITSWKGVGLSYIVLLNFLIVTPVIVYAGFKLDHTLFAQEEGKLNLLEQQTGIVVAQLPKMQWHTDGKMEMLGGEAKTIYLLFNDREIPFALLDEDATRADFEHEYTPGIIVNETGILFRHGSEKSDLVWADVGIGGFFFIDQEVATQLALEGIKWLKNNRQSIYVGLGILSWTVLMLIMFVWRGAQAFLYGVVALGIAFYFKIEARYADMVRLSAVALTPMVLVDLGLVLYFKESSPLPAFIVAVCAYLVCALRPLRSTASHPSNN